MPAASASTAAAREREEAGLKLAVELGDPGVDALELLGRVW